MKTNEERLSDLEVTAEDHGKKLDQVLEAIKGLQSPSASSLTKPEPKKKPEVCTDSVKVNYTENGQKKSGSFQLLQPMVHYKGENLLAKEALANPEIMTYLVEGTWVGTKGKSKFVKEIV